jgi:hypothetical protein
MTARPFTPSMGRARRPVSGWTQALGLLAVLVCAAWAGQHGLGRVIGWVVSVVLVVVLAVGIVASGAWFAGWAVRAIRAELEVGPLRAARDPQEDPNG